MASLADEGRRDRCHTSARPEIEHERDLERRVADLEALIEEARRRARRRRTRRGVAALLVVAGGVVAFIGFGGHGGGGAGTAATARAHGSRPSSATADSPPLAALPPDAGVVDSFAFDPRNPEIVYVMTSGGLPPGAGVFKTTDGGAHWQATATSWPGGHALTADPRHPGTLYAGTEFAVYKTVDGGRGWRPSHRGLVYAASCRPRKGMADRARGRPRQHEHRLCGLRPPQQEHRRRPQLEDRVPAARHAQPGMTSLRLQSPRPAPRRSTRSSATSAHRRRHPQTDTPRSTSRPTPARPGRQQQSFTEVSPHRTRRRSATPDHRLRGDRRQSPEDDQRRQDLAVDRSRPPDLSHPRTLSLPLPSGRHGAGGRPTPQRHRLRSPDPGRHLQDQQRRTYLDPLHPRGPAADPLPLHSRGRPRPPDNDLRRRRKRNRKQAPDSQKHQRRSHLGHRTVTTHPAKHTTHRSPGRVCVTYRGSRTTRCPGRCGFSAS